VRFVCDLTPGGGARVFLALNPATRTEVKLTPPFPWGTREQLDVFAEHFERYCEASWAFGRFDPAEVNVSQWPDFQSPQTVPPDSSSEE